MPIYTVNNKTFNIPDDKVDAFEKKYPHAYIEYHTEDKKYNIPLSARDGFLKKYPNATYTKQEDIKPSNSPSVEQIQDQSPVAQAKSDTLRTDDEYFGNPAFSPKAMRNRMKKIENVAKETKSSLDNKSKELSEELDNLSLSSPIATGHTKDNGLQFNPSTGKLERTFSTPYGNTTTNKQIADLESYEYRTANNMTVSGRMRNANARLEKLKAQAEERERKVVEEWEQKQSEEYQEAQDKGFLGILQHSMRNANNPSNTPRTWIEGDPEYRALQAAIHETEEEIATIKRESDRQDGKRVGFWRGFGEITGDIRTWDFGIGNLLDNGAKLSIDNELAEQYKSDGTRQAEQELLEATYLNQQAQQEYGANDSFWFRAGTMTGHMPSFMLDFALTGGGFDGINILSKATSKGATKIIGKEVVEKMAKEGFKSYVKKNGIKGFGQEAANWTIKALGTTADDLIIRAPLMTNTVAVAKTASDIADRKLGNVVINEDGTYDFSNDRTWSSAIWQGEANAIIENFSEMFGTHLPSIKPADMAKLAEVMGAKRLGNILAKANTASLTTIQESLRKMGVSNYLGEVTEEYYGQLWRTMLNLDDAYIHNPDGTRTNLLATGRFHGDIWGGMALSMGLMSAGKYSLSATNYTMMKHDVNKADKRASKIFGDDVWEPLRHTLDLTTNENIGSIAEAIINDKNFTNEEVSAVLDYMEKSMYLRGLNLATMANSRITEDNGNEQQANESYLDGYNTSTPQEMNDAKNMYEYQRVLMEELVDGNMLDRIDNDPLSTLHTINHNENWTREEKDIVLDYLNAKATYDGMIQRVRDDIDGKIEESNSLIDSHTNKGTGQIHGAVDRSGNLVYIVSGNVVAYEDGTGIDLNRSDESIIIRDAETGELQQVSPEFLSSLYGAQDPNEQKELNAQQIREQIAQEEGNKIDGTVDFNNKEQFLNDMANQIAITMILAERGFDKEYIKTFLNNAHIVENPDGTLTFTDGQNEVAVTKQEIQQQIDANARQRAVDFNETVKQTRNAITQQDKNTPETTEYSVGDNVVLIDSEGNKIDGTISMIEDDTYVIDYSDNNGTRHTLYLTQQELDNMTVERNGVGIKQPVTEHELVTNNSTEEKVSTTSPNSIEKNVSLQTQEHQDEVPQRISQNNDRTQASQNGRMEEAAIRLRSSSEALFRDSGKSQSEISESEVKEAESYAKENGIWIPFNDVFNLGRPGKSGNENDTYFSPEGYVYKVNNLINSGDIASLLERLLLHNQVFPETAYELVGFTGFEGRNVYPIVKQSAVNNPTEATTEEIEAYMTSLGFTKISETGYTNNEIVVSDLHPRNVLKDADGDIYVVDAEFKKTSQSLIPKDESGNPIYEQADSETAWDALIEDAEGDEMMAGEVAKSMIADKEAELKKLEKSKIKEGKTPAEKMAALKERKAEVEKIKKDIEAWKEIAFVPIRRQIAQDKRIHQEEAEAAAKRKAEEERLMAERKEAERKEQELLNGIPDYSEDTPQNARARGYRRVNGHIEERQQPIQAIQGKETDVEFSNDVRPKGHYAVIDASQLQPSHIQGNRNPLHFLDEAQPKERNDEASIVSAQKIAGNIRPATITTGETAYVGTPTINTRGEVIQGNSRSDALRLMWNNHQEQGQKYKQYLIDNAEQFGLNLEDVSNMESPVLVRMLDVSDEQAITLGQYVAQDTESGGVERIKPKNAVKKMGDDINSFANMLLDSADEDTSFAELLDQNGVKVLKWMAQKGYITDTQYSSAFDTKGSLTAEAKNDLRGIMYQSIFEGGNTRLEEMFNALPAKAQKAILATAHRDFNSPNSERMIEEIQNSIRAFYALMQDEQFAKAKNFKDATKAVEAWQKQYQMDDVTGEGYLPSEKFSNFALHLAKMYKGEKQSNIQGVFAELYDLIQGTKEDNLFEQADKTPRTLVQAIKEVLNIDYNGQRRNNVLGGDNKTSQQGQHGRTGDVASRERTESGEQSANDSGRTDEDSGSSTFEIYRQAENESGDLRTAQTVHQSRSERKRPEQTPDVGRKGDSTGVADDATQEVLGASNRGDIRVLEEGLDTSYRAYSDDSERTRRTAESERLVNLAKQHGLFVPAEVTKTFTDKVRKRTGESVVYIDKAAGKVTKVKDPYAKAAMKSGVQPEDAAFEHLVHNLLFPETAYTLEGISEEMGDVRIVLSQDFIQNYDQPTKEQITEALAARGLFPEDNYSFGNELVSVTDVEGDNVLLGEDGTVYFIDPIIRFKKPLREILAALGGAEQKAPTIGEQIQTTKTETSTTPIQGYSYDEIIETVKDEITDIISDNEIEGVDIKEIWAHGSRMRGDSKSDSDLDIVMFYEGDAREDDLFNLISESNLAIEGIKIDVNPIRVSSHKDIEAYKKKSKQYDEEKKASTIGEKILAAEKEVNTSPTDKQKEAGNYKKGHVQIGTFNVTIEQPKGSVRSGVDANGKKWETTMHNTYGYIRGTEGVDGDHIDVFLSNDIDGWNGNKIFVVDQYNEDGTFDEHKVMLGFNDIEEAESAYLDNYEKGWEKKHKIVVSPIHTEEFEKWINSSHRKTKAFAEYKSVQVSENSEKRQQLSKFNVGDIVLDYYNKKLYRIKKHSPNGVSTIAKLDEEGNEVSTTQINAHNNARYSLAEAPVKAETPTISQESEQVSDQDNTPYTINPTQYTTKKGKVLDMHLVKFAGTLTKEQQRAAKELAKAEKGWYDREQGGFMMRSEESAKQLAETISNDKEAVNNAQPVSIDDIKSVNNGDVLFTEPQQTQEEKDKNIHSPIWQYVVHVDQDGYTTISRDDVSGGYPIGDARFRYSTDSPEEMLDILRNPLNGMQEALEAVGVTLENKIKTRELNRKIKEERDQKLSELRTNGVNGYKIGDEVIYKGKKATIHDFEEFGDNKPVLDVGLAPVMYEVVEWKDIQNEKLSKTIFSSAFKHLVSEDGKYNIRITEVDGAKRVVTADLNTADVSGEGLKLSFSEMDAILNGNNWHEKIATEPKNEGQFGLVSDERMNELKERLRKKLGGQMNIGIDPEILAIGLEIAVGHLDRGIKTFTDFAKVMISDLGDVIRPYLKAFYNGARELPEVVENGLASDMTSYDEVQTFDVANFDKTSINAIDTAETVVREEEVEKEVEIAKDRIKKTRNNKKKSVISQSQTNMFDDLFDNENTNDNGLQGIYEVRSEGVSANGDRDSGTGSKTGNSQEVQQESRRTDGGRVGGSGRTGNEVQHGDKRSSGRIQGITEKKNTRNNRSERGKDHAPASVDARIEANIKAIELAKQLLENGEQASKEQMEVLRKFSGWGGLGKAFNERSTYTHEGRYHYNEPTIENKKIRELIGEEAYQQAVKSANSSYYTPAYVVDTLWDIAEQMGFKGGNILEGSAGIGNILGQMPAHISENSDIHAIEIDYTSGAILSLLYPDAKVEIQGFEETRIANGSVDLAITNVPFVTGLRVNDTTGDKDLSKKFHNIHDFCIAKNVRKLREGGLGIFITSNGTLDNSKKLRDWIVSEGNSDFVGAFRMHNKTFGGTSVTSDIIVIRKRVNGQKSANAIDVSSVSGERVADYNTGETRKVKGVETPVVKQLSMDYNQYFIEHPEMMSGKMHFAFEKGDTFRPTSKGLYPSQDKNQEQMLSDFVQSFTAEEFGERTTDDATGFAEAMQGKKLGELFVKDGKLYTYTLQGAKPLEVNANKVKGHTKVECFEAYTAIKEALAEVLEYQTKHENDNGLNPLMTKLNKAYDEFVKTYGHFNKNTAIAFLRNDVDYANVASIETYKEIGDGKGGVKQTFGKADVMKKRVIEKEKEPTPTNVKDGIIASIFKFGRVDVPYIANQLGLTEDDVKRGIIDKGLGFENPVTRQMEVSYQYLSGNVREKLLQARENNENGEFDRNIKALQDVLPMDIPAHLIDFTLGSSWVEPELYNEYVKDRTDADVKFTAVGGTWFMKEPYFTNYEKNRSMGVTSEMLGKTIMGHTLIEAAIQNKSITVSTIRKNWDGTTETIVDKEATQACASKIDEIRQDFKEWARQKMQSDPEMSAKMERIYNDTFNNYVPMKVTEEFLPKYFIGAIHKYEMRPHQKRAIVRGTMQPLMLAHEVGSGKTFTLISTAMEMRRLGTARKPMIVVQNATVGQFVANAKELYPNAKILTLEDSDRNAEGRKNFYAKIKYNDWDMIIIPQSTFEFIPDSEEREMAFVQDKIEEKMLILEQMKEADPDGNSMITRQAEREIALLEEELAELSETASMRRTARDEKKRAVALQNAEVKAMEMLDRRTDDVENFDDMGIDALLIDEAHEYKHLGFATAMQRGVKGVDPSYSKKSQGVFLKTQAVLEKNNGRNVIFATGTPISNTAAEIWTFMRYLMPADTMKEYGIYYFDDFVRNFGNIQQMLEFTTSGKFKENNRFAGYVNLPELVRIWSGVSDTVNFEDIEEDSKKQGKGDLRPEIETGKAQDIYLPQTRALRSIMKFVKAQLEKYDQMSGKQKKENSHIPLTMYGIAKAAAVDARLVEKDAEDDPNSKTNEAVRQTLRSLKETENYKGTVAIFADNYQNKHTGFNLYEDIRTKLIAEGVNENEIVVIKSGMTVKKKLEIFEKVNRGEIRVILGSTFTLGTGVNIQERLHTLIHLDAPNRPMDYTQRNGRIQRQGNIHKDMGIPVRILRFGVEDSLDVTAYQRLKTKGAIADSIMKGKQMMSDSMSNRVLEEEEDVFGDTVAQLSGSEYAMLKNNAEKNVRKYESRKKQWEADQTYIHNAKPRIKGLIKDAETRIELNSRNLKEVQSAFPDGKFKEITIGKKRFTSIESMEDFFKEHNKSVIADTKKIKDGEMSGNQTREVTIQIDGYSFIVKTELTKEYSGKGMNLFAEVHRKMTYSCPQLGIEDAPVRQALLRNGVEDIVGNVITGKDFAERLESAERSKDHNESELEQLMSREGKPFEYEKELEQVKKQFIEYSELMKKEMAEKEAKYAEMDASVESATDISNTEEEDDVLYREEEYKTEKIFGGIWIEDKQEFAKFVSAVNNNYVFEEGSEGITYTDNHFYAYYWNIDGEPIPYIDVYLNAEESQDVVNEVSKEINHVRRGKGIKKYIDRAITRAGSSNGKNNGNHGNNTSIPHRAGNDKLGGNILRKGRYFDNPSLYVKTQRTDRFRINNNNSSPTRAQRKQMIEHVEDLAKRLHLDNIEIVNSVSGLEGKKKGAKGFFSKKSGKITIVVPNHTSIADIEKTLLHEAVAHYGLRKLFGKHFDTFLDNVYNNVEESIRKHIAELAIKKYNYDFRKATEEYLASLAERTNFENVQQSSWWQKIKDFFADMLSKLGFKDFRGVTLTDNELRYILWRSYENLSSNKHNGIFGEAADIAKQYELGTGEFENNIEIVNREFNRRLLDLDKNREQKDRVLRLGRPGRFLLNSGIIDADIEMEFDKFVRKSSDTYRNAHPFSAEDIMNLPKAINSPIAVFDSTVNDGDKVILTELKKVKDNFIVVIRAKQRNKKGNIVLEVNEISTLYPKDAKGIVNWINNGLTRNADKTKTLQWLEALRTHLGTELTTEELYLAANIIQNFDNPTVDDDILFRDKDDSFRNAQEEYNFKVRRPNENGSVKHAHNIFRRMKEAYFDSMNALNILQNAILRETGGNMKGIENAYIAENAMSSANKGQMDIYERDFLKPLLESVKILIKKGAKYPEIVSYLVAKHGLERNEVFSKRDAEKDGGIWDGTIKDYSGLTSLTGENKDFTTKAEKIVNEFESKYKNETQDLWDKINAATKETLRKELESGLISKDMYNEANKMFSFYIPLRGWNCDVAENEFEYMTFNNRMLPPLLYKARGRRSLADDPIATIGYMAQSTIVRGNRNLMKQRFFNFVLKNPTSLCTVSEQWYVRDNATGTWLPENPVIPEDATAEEIADIIEQFEKRMESLKKKKTAKKEYKGLELGMHVKTKEGQEHMVRVMRNGKEFCIYINGNPRAAQALNGLTNMDTNRSNFYRGCMAVKNFMARNFTSRNPVFVLKNLTRDIQQAGNVIRVKENREYIRQYRKNINRKAIQVPVLIVKFNKGTLNMNDEVERYFAEFIKHGGETGYTNINTVEDYKRDIARFVKEAQNGKSITKECWRGFWNSIEYLNRCAEDVTRFTVYMTSRQMGRDISTSVYDAKEVTVNFNKKGSGEIGAKYLNFAYIFFNAALQSTSQFAKLLVRYPVKTITRMMAKWAVFGMLCPVITMALQSLFGTDDDDESFNYYDIPEWIRRNNYILSVSSKGYITIPLPHMMRSFYGMGEIALSCLLGKIDVEDAIKDAALGFTDFIPLDFTGNGGDFITNISPTILQPIVQVRNNTDYFGIPIYRKTPWNENAPEHTKAYKGTSTWLVDATRWINSIGLEDGKEHTDVDRGWWSPNPAVIEHLIEGYTGGMGKTMIKLFKTISMLWDEDMRNCNNAVLVSDFYREVDERTANSESNRKFYDAIDEMEETQRRKREYEKGLKMGVMEYAEIIDNLMKSPTYGRYSTIKTYSDIVKKLENAMEGIDKSDREEVETAIMNLKTEMFEELERISDIENHFDEFDMENIESNMKDLKDEWDDKIKKTRKRA